ncbi:MAG: hypothetical protein JWO59_2366 [Chloroflexi bacterium]|nr:hypothetical protein [Chloroflexota bacterium]
MLPSDRRDLPFHGRHTNSVGKRCVCTHTGLPVASGNAGCLNCSHVDPNVDASALITLGRIERQLKFAFQILAASLLPVRQHCLAKKPAIGVQGLCIFKSFAQSIWHDYILTLEKRVTRDHDARGIAVRVICRMRSIRMGIVLKGCSRLVSGGHCRRAIFRVSAKQRRDHIN